jgi:hypothetical protein
LEALKGVETVPALPWNAGNYYTDWSKLWYGTEQIMVSNGEKYSMKWSKLWYGLEQIMVWNGANYGTD